MPRRSETPKAIAANVKNRVIGSNRVALSAATRKAEELGYRVLDLGAFVEGETRVAYGHRRNRTKRVSATAFRSRRPRAFCSAVKRR